MEFYIYLGNTETLFNQGGLANENNLLFDDLDQFEGLEVKALTKEEFTKQVALPYKLGFLIENEDILFSHEPTNDLFIAQDKYDGVCYIFSKSK